MRVLILGSTGMLGQALISESRARNIDVFGMAESGADYSFDIRNDAALDQLIITLVPDVVINTVAIIDQELCEENVGLAYAINARPVGIIANACKRSGIYFVHISTDHFYTGDVNRKHQETESVILINEYARTKYLAEVLAHTYENSLVVRTNIVGFRGQPDRPTFIEWIVNSLKNNVLMTLFDDYFTSSIDTYNFSKILCDLILKKPRGILNISSAQVSSKKDFIQTVALKMGYDVSHYPKKSVLSLSGARRAESLGLDVSRAEEIVGYSFPDLNAVVNSLITKL